MVQPQGVFGISDDKDRFLSDLDVGVAEPFIPDPNTRLLPSEVVPVLIAFAMARTVILRDSVSAADEEVRARNGYSTRIAENDLRVDPDARKLEKQAQRSFPCRLTSAIAPFKCPAEHLDSAPPFLHRGSDRLDRNLLTMKRTVDHDDELNET